MNKKTSNDDRDAPPFEEAMQRLEDIVEAMEQGELPLDTAMQQFEEGMQLVRLCTRRLNEVEQKIEQLIEREGQLEEQPFTPEV